MLRHSHISREIQERTGQTVSFGALLKNLHDHGLPLPRFPTDPQSPGVLLVKRLAERACMRNDFPGNSS